MSHINIRKLNTISPPFLSFTIPKDTAYRLCLVRTVFMNQCHNNFLSTSGEIVLFKYLRSFLIKFNNSRYKLYLWLPSNVLEKFIGPISEFFSTISTGANNISSCFARIYRIRTSFFSWSSWFNVESAMISKKFLYTLNFSSNLFCLMYCQILYIPIIDNTIEK